MFFLRDEVMCCRLPDLRVGTYLNCPLILVRRCCFASIVCSKRSVGCRHAVLSGFNISTMIVTDIMPTVSTTLPQPAVTCGHLRPSSLAQILWGGSRSMVPARRHPCHRPDTHPRGDETRSLEIATAPSRAERASPSCSTHDGWLRRANRSHYDTTAALRNVPSWLKLVLLLLLCRSLARALGSLGAPRRPSRLARRLSRLGWEGGWIRGRGLDDCRATSGADLLSALPVAACWMLRPRRAYQNAEELVRQSDNKAYRRACPPSAAPCLSGDNRLTKQSSPGGGASGLFASRMRESFGVSVVSARYM